MNLLHLSVHEIRDAVRTRKISALEVTDFFLKRIEKLDPKINSFITVNPKARDDAKRIDARIAAGEDVGRLAGVPVAIKDLLCTKGLRTTAASKILENFIPPYSATVVERLLQDGAVVIGKANCDEFAMGSSNETSAFGICRNPWNLDYVPGGSSGGSAAAVAAGLAPIAIGTDTGGSIRQPSSLCGITGIKPTYSRVSRYGIVAYASSLDQAGPMGLNARDCALVLEVISGACRYDSTTSEQKVPVWSELMLKSEKAGALKGRRIGFLKEGRSDKVDAATTKILQQAEQVLREQGAEICEVSIPMLSVSIPIYYLIATSEASGNLARYDGVRFGHRTEAQASSLEDFYSKNRAEAFGSEVKRRIILGTYALSSGYYDAYYAKACQVRRLLSQEYLKAFEACDVILSPVTTSPAFRIGERISDPLEMYLNDIFTTSTNLAGLPGMSVPGGFSPDGLPIGVQLTGKHFDELSLFEVAQSFESHWKREMRWPHVEV